MQEPHSTEGVKAVDPAGSASPSSADGHLMFFNAVVLQTDGEKGLRPVE